MQSLFQSSDGGIEGMIYLYAFLTGGVICAIVQIIMSTSKIQPGNIMVGLVCTGAFLGALGIYEPFREWAGAGASVPLLGFGNVLVGISAALVLGYLASLIFRPKLKK